MTLINLDQVNNFATITKIVTVSRKMLFQRHLVGPHCRPHLEQVHILKTADWLAILKFFNLDISVSGHDNFHDDMIM